MRTVKKLTGALVMAGMVAGALVVSATPAAAEPMGSYKGFIMMCSAIKTAAESVPSASASAVLMALYEAKCM